MKKLTLFLPLLFPVCLYAQKVKKVTDKAAKATYFVLKSNPDIKHGLYTGYGYNTKLSEGLYENGERSGEWKFYGLKGELVHRYDYSLKKATYRPKTVSDVEHKILRNGDTVKTTLDYPAEVLGGEIVIAWTLQNTINYPLQAKDRNIQGKVYVEFTVDQTGKTDKFRVLKGIGYGCDEEAVRVLKLIPQPWLPAEKDGKLVTMVFVIPIEYRLN